MLLLLLIWLAVGIGLMWLVSRRRSGSMGLPLAYFLGLSLIHVPGAMLYVDAGELNSMADATTVGFAQTVIGMVAFLAGVAIARHAFVRTAGQGSTVVQSQEFNAEWLAGLDRLAIRYLLAGSMAFFVLLPVVGALPTVTAIVASLGSLIIVGICLRVWAAGESRNWLKFWSTMALLPLLPLGTLIQGGFLGYGVYWVLAIVAFLFAQSQRRLIYVLLAPAVLFAGLSLFVNYIGARGDIRQLVWHERAGIGDRLQRVADVFRNFEWLDLSSPRHREAIDLRLNQNFLVGVAAARLDAGQVEYASGNTVPTMVLALIPRALWPDKPQVAGGQRLVRDFTGMEFAEGTSVGAGQVFEFYVNFGTLGVIGGFLLYGWLLGRMDLAAIKYLRQGDQSRFLFWFLVALALLQPGGNLMEIVVSAASSAVTAYGIGHLIHRRWSANDTADLPRGTAGRL